MPSKTGASIVPVSWIWSSVSKISNTLLAAIIPNCISLNLSAICRSGLNNIPMNIVYENKSPNVVKVSPFNILNPPYKTMNPKVNDEMISAIGKKIELYNMVLIQAFRCLSLMFLNLSNSMSSRLNNWTIFIPVTRSWTKEFILAISVRTSSNATCIFRWNIRVKKTKMGMATMTIQVSFQFM